MQAIDRMTGGLHSKSAFTYTEHLIRLQHSGATVQRCCIPAASTTVQPTAAYLFARA